MVARFRLGWQPIKKHPVAFILIALFIVLGVLVLVGGYIFHWAWTGFNGVQVTYKTLYDWLQLLIVPFVIAVAGYVINLTISRGEQEATKQRDKTEHEIAQDNQHGAMVQEYINQMSELILHEQLRESQPEDDVRSIARVRTLTILPPLDIHRKRIVIQFVFEARLIDEGKGIIDLSGADLTKAFLGGLDLTGANLSRTDLIGAELMCTHLTDINLSNATLIGANLTSAELTGANLNEAAISINNVAGKQPIITNLFNADLTGAKISDKQLAKTKS